MLRHPYTTLEYKISQSLLIGLLPIVLGGFIYLTYRVDTLQMFYWLRQLGFDSFIDFIRTKSFFQNLPVPNWVKFSLPDGFWLFSFNYIMLLLWDFKINKLSIIWIVTAPLIGVLYEIGQLLEVINGTFDLCDLAFIFIATILSFSFKPYHKRTIKT